MGTYTYLLLHHHSVPPSAQSPPPIHAMSRVTDSRRNVGQKRQLRTLESDDKDFSITYSCNKRLKLNNGGSHQVHRQIRNQNQMSKPKDHRTIQATKVIRTHGSDDDAKSLDHKEQERSSPMLSRDEEDTEMASPPSDETHESEQENIIACARQGFLGWMEWVDMSRIRTRTKSVQPVNNVVAELSRMQNCYEYECRTVANFLFNRAPVM